MTLTAADVAEIMRLVEQSTFEELNLEIDGIKLKLRRTGAAQAGPFAAELTAAAPPDLGAAKTAADAVAKAPGDANLSNITSPMLGTFYRSPKPGSAPFVEIGSVVDEGSVIAIIEVMKLMNTVRAGTNGVIAAILPADETLVEFGQVLMRVRRDN